MVGHAQANGGAGSQDLLGLKLSTPSPRDIFSLKLAHTRDTVTAI